MFSYIGLQCGPFQLCCVARQHICKIFAIKIYCVRRIPGHNGIQQLFNITCVDQFNIYICCKTTVNIFSASKLFSITRTKSITMLRVAYIYIFFLLHQLRDAGTPGNFYVVGANERARGRPIADATTQRHSFARAEQSRANGRRGDDNRRSFCT